MFVAKRADPDYRYVDPPNHALATLALNATKKFGGKTSQCDLTKKMKEKFKLVKNLHWYSIKSITNPMVKITTQILTRKVMRTCCAHEVPTPVISLFA